MSTIPFEWLIIIFTIQNNFLYFWADIQNSYLRLNLKFNWENTATRFNYKIVPVTLPQRAGIGHFIKQNHQLAFWYRLSVIYIMRHEKYYFKNVSLVFKQTLNFFNQAENLKNLFIILGFGSPIFILHWNFISRH